MHIASCTCYVFNRVGAPAVTFKGGQAFLLRPAAIAVEDNADALGTFHSRTLKNDAG